MSKLHKLLTGTEKGVTLPGALSALLKYYEGREAYIISMTPLTIERDYSVIFDEATELGDAFRIECERAERREAHGLKAPRGFVIGEASLDHHEILGKFISLYITYQGNYKSLQHVRYKVFIYFERRELRPAPQHIERPRFPWWLKK